MAISMSQSAAGLFIHSPPSIGKWENLQPVLMLINRGTKSETLQLYRQRPRCHKSAALDILQPPGPASPEAETMNPGSRN